MLTAKKSLSQNFLTNQDWLKKINAAISNFLENSKPKTVLEIGAGSGAITDYLNKLREILNYQLEIIEIDNRAVSILQEKFSQIKIIEGDALKLLNQDQNYLNLGAMVANLPFRVGSRLLVDFPIISKEADFLVIVQNEVARKTLPESKFTLFGGWINLFYSPKLVFKIPPAAFTPPPKVDSALLKGTRLNNNFNNLNPETKKKLLNFFKSIIFFPRKSLLNNLKNSHLSSLEIENMLVSLKLENSRLGWDNYQKVLHFYLEKYQ